MGRLGGSFVGCVVGAMMGRRPPGRSSKMGPDPPGQLSVQRVHSPGNSVGFQFSKGSGNFKFHTIILAQSGVKKDLN